MWGRGTVLGGRYALTERIGGGAMGEVWRAGDRVLERQVAVKILLPSRLDDDAFTVRFRREAKVLAAIDHPGVVGVYDYGEHEFRRGAGAAVTDGASGDDAGDASGEQFVADDAGDDDPEGTRVAYIVMELVEGRSLEEVRAELGLVPVAQALDLVAQALDALHAVHRRGVVHRDIKPSNLMLRGDGRVAVADFGIARASARTRLTPSHAALGTPLYMAPEQAEGLPVVPASDLYSIGVVCYELLTGEPPFGGATPVEVALKHVREPAPGLPDDIPKPVRTFVAKALAKDPEDRYANAAVMAAAARRAAAGDPPGTENSPVPETPTPIPTPTPTPTPEPAVGAVVTDAATKGADAAGRKGKGKRRGPVVLIAAVVVPTVTVTTLYFAPIPWRSEASPSTGQPSASADGDRSPRASPSVSASPSGSASASSTGSPTSTAGGAGVNARGEQGTNTEESGGGSASPGAGSGDGGAESGPSAVSSASVSGEPSPTVYATEGVSMGDDPKAIPGSGAYAGAAGGCSAWLDDNGSGNLYGMLNTSLFESCNAQLIRSDGLKVSLTARYGAERTSPISNIGHTMRICVWEKGDSPDTRQCSASFGIHNGTPKAE